MPKFVIEREIPKGSQMSEEELREASLRSLEVLHKMGPEIQWLHSYVTDDKIYCIYFAPDESFIRRHGQLLGARVDRVSAVRKLVDPATYE